MRLFIILLFLLVFNTNINGQVKLPKKDTIIYTRECKIKYQVKKHAVFMYTYKDDELNGEYKSFYLTGKVWCEGNYENNVLTGFVYEYTSLGDTAKVQYWNKSKLISEKIYWQSIPEEQQKYIYVSKNGFETYSNGVKKSFKSDTPDNIIEEQYNIDFKKEYYIWKGGKRVKYSATLGD